MNPNKRVRVEFSIWVGFSISNLYIKTNTLYIKTAKELTEYIWFILFVDSSSLLLLLQNQPTPSFLQRRTDSIFFCFIFLFVYPYLLLLYKSTQILSSSLPQKHQFQHPMQLEGGVVISPSTLDLQISDLTGIQNRSSTMDRSSTSSFSKFSVLNKSTS